MKFICVVLIALWGVGQFWSQDDLMLWNGPQFLWTQPLTYWMVHDGLLHLLTNVGVLWVLSDRLESYYEPRDVPVPGMFLMGCLFGSLGVLPFEGYALAGASAGVACIVTVYCLTFTYKKVMGLNLNKVLLGIAALEVISCLIWPQRIAHLIGMSVGLWYVYSHAPRVRSVA